MIFVKLIRILAAIFAFWLILHILHRLLGKNTTKRTTRQGDNGRKSRKFVESHIVEKTDQTDEKTKS